LLDIINVAKSAISSGVPIRPSGTESSVRAAAASDSQSLSAPPVRSIGPGAIALTKILREANSFAVVFVSPITPALAAT